MRKLLFVLFFFCATAQAQPTPAQMAVLQYFAALCKQQGITETEALTGCVLMHIARAQAGTQRPRQPHFFEELGSVYRDSVPRQTECETRYVLGAWQTICR